MVITIAMCAIRAVESIWAFESIQENSMKNIQEHLQKKIHWSAGVQIVSPSAFHLSKSLSQELYRYEAVWALTIKVIW